MALASSGALMPTVATTTTGRWDRRLAYQIFICMLRSVQILWTGKMHYVWISAGAASDKENRTLRKRRQIVLFSEQRLNVCIMATLTWGTFFNSGASVDVTWCITYANNNLFLVPCKLGHTVASTLLLTPAIIKVSLALINTKEMKYGKKYMHSILDSHHAAKCNILLGIWASLRRAEGIITSYCISHFKAVPAKLSYSSYSLLCAWCAVWVSPSWDLGVEKLLAQAFHVICEKQAGLITFLEGKQRENDCLSVQFWRYVDLWSSDIVKSDWEGKKSQEKIIYRERRH